VDAQGVCETQVKKLKGRGKGKMDESTSDGMHE